SAVLEQAGVRATARGEELSIDDFQRIAAVAGGDLPVR
ncbi:MAG TPA: 16S rRNA (adenine(1518)-N(6)/adenine(1519)-N(6))-dimethyltransferase, partial [Microbacterium sp.]|nr:16S rRNA (adenine(1518)-N(6)/adenine(1519)-N(6))-dimethyltransferase [Microbacterium sp.]